MKETGGRKRAVKRSAGGESAERYAPCIISLLSRGGESCFCD